MVPGLGCKGVPVQIPTAILLHLTSVSDATSGRLRVSGPNHDWRDRYAHLEFAGFSGRVLVTQDDDSCGYTHRVYPRLASPHDLLAPEEMSGRVEFL